MRKGPWTEEEDKVLLQHGPQEWSSIRSNGLLARTGKSCRLRWVNKLRPNLKSSKFTADEVREVMELQARFGNKWARIATYLQGRTDNNVKNFWSVLQKRLARLLSKRQKKNINKGKAPSSSLHPETATIHQGAPPDHQDSFESNSFVELQYDVVDYGNVSRSPYYQAFAFEGGAAQLLPAAAGKAASSSNIIAAAQFAPPLPSDHPAYPLIINDDFPELGWPERSYVHGDGGAMDDLVLIQEVIPMVQSAQMIMPLFCNDDDLPLEYISDVVDTVDQLPPPPPPSPSSRGDEF